MARSLIAEVALALAFMSSAALAATYTAGTTGEARYALSIAGNGDTVLLRPGEYDNLDVSNKTSFTLRSLDPANPAVIRPNSTTDLGLYIGNPNNVTVSDLKIDYTHLGTATGNGIHIDKGTSPVFGNGLTLRNISVKMTAPAGNIDGLHMSGVHNFTFENLRFENWGTDGGGIDIVGGYDGIIRNSYFKSVYNQTGTGIQAKGGARGIIMRANRFDNAGGRALNLGGSTGLQFFEPGINFEAQGLIAEGNVIVDGYTPVAFTSMDGGEFRYNLSYSSDRWLGRILREQTAPGFLNVQNGKYHHNRLIWENGALSSETVNYSSTANYASFTFSDNQWYNRTNPSASVPNLPPGVTQFGNTYGVNPNVDPDHIVPWTFAWGVWLVNGSLATDTFSLAAQSEPLMVAIPGAGATLDLSAAYPLVGNWTFTPAGSSMTMGALSDAVLLRQSLVPEPGGLLVLAASWLLTTRNAGRKRTASSAETGER